MRMHIGRAWGRHDIEDACPCPQEPCGLIDIAKARPDCDHHAPRKARSMRQGHPAHACPGPEVHVGQVWVSKVESDREFLVQRARDGVVHGMDYYTNESSTRDKSIPLNEFAACYRLVEDAPHLREAR